MAVALAQTATRSGFPIATLAVNVIGCFVIGAASAWLTARPSMPPELQLFMVVGVLGGFTTYSTFANETFLLARYGHVITAVVNVAVHLIAGLCAAWAGYALMRS